MLGRLGIEAVAAYRAHADTEELLDSADQEVMDLILTGLHHEQQHQELIVTDIRHAFSNSPIFPRYAPEPVEPTVAICHATGAVDRQWWDLRGRPPIRFGHRVLVRQRAPVHHSLLRDFAISDRPVSNAEFVAFIEEDRYRRPGLRLSEGWTTAKAANWEAPGYWYRDGKDWWVYTLHGLRSLRLDEPVCHVSFFEAAAYARWVHAAFIDRAAPIGMR